jgi:hypothetical protein
MSVIDYVHRDYSPGNVYAAMGVPQGQPILRVGDLEFAKKREFELPVEGVKHDMRLVSNDFLCEYETELSQGTWQFWAVEVEKGKYLFDGRNQIRNIANPPNTPQKALGFDKGGNTTLGIKHVKSAPKPPVEIPGFYHNPLHDFESILWMAAESLLDGIPPDYSSQMKITEDRDGKVTKEAPWDFTGLRKYLPKIFPSTLVHERLEFIQDEYTGANLDKICAPKLELPIDLLSSFQRDLRNAYLAAEKNLSVTGKIDASAWDKAFATKCPNTILRMVELVDQQYTQGVTLIEFSTDLGASVKKQKIGSADGL